MKKPVPFTPFSFDKRTNLFSRRLPHAIINESGGEFIGFQRVPGAESVALFLDPMTGTSLGLPASEITPENVRKSLLNSRKAFGVYTDLRPGLPFNPWWVPAAGIGAFLWYILIKFFI